MNLTTLSSILPGIRRNILTTPHLHLATTGTITFCLLIIGAFAIIYANIHNLVDRWEQKIRIVAYISNKLSKEQIGSLQQGLVNLPGVDEVRYVSKAEAMNKLKKHMQERSALLNGLRENPLPASFEIRLIKTGKSWKQVRQLASQIEGFDAVDDVEYGKPWLHQLTGFTSFFKLASYIVGILILTTTVFVCTNTMKLTLYARRQELETMKLVGATDAFIKTPVIAQNLLEGLIGGLAALGLLFALYKFFVAKVQSPKTLFSLSQIRFLPPCGMAALLAAGMLIGWLGTYFALRQYLRR